MERWARRERIQRERGGIGGVGGEEEEEGNGWRKICQEGEGEGERQGGGEGGVVMRGCKGGGRERSLAEFGFIYFSLFPTHSLSLSLSWVFARIPFLPH